MTPTSPNLRIAIVGGGAAGFFAAIRAKQSNPRAEVRIYEKAPKVLMKVALTGGGRCNVSNSFAQVNDFKQVYPRGDKLMKRLFNRFSHVDAYNWFETQGVPLLTQTDDCVFPQAQDALRIVNCLVATAQRLGVRTYCKHQLVALEKGEDKVFCLTFKGIETPVCADRVVLTTGGAPKCEGHAMLAALGHAMQPAVPSLFTFNLKEEGLRALMGLVVEHAALSLPATKHSAQGALLLTHWGLSGPATLRLSSYAARYLAVHNYRAPLAINWLATHTQAALLEQLQQFVRLHPQQFLSSQRPFGMQARLWQYLLHRASLSADKKWGELGKKAFNKLLETLTNDQYLIEGRGSWKEEFVTCGGVALGSVHAHTLMSKHVEHLFFAGEVLDVDALTGGFNLQAAWTTGFVAGEEAAKVSG